MCEIYHSSNNKSRGDLVEIEELRKLAKSKGIRNWHNKKRENLEKELIPYKLKEQLERQDLAYNRENDGVCLHCHGEGCVACDARFIEAPKKPKIEVLITKDDHLFFKSIGFKVEWLASLANQYGFDKIQYAVKFKAFRCFKNGPQVDWINVNELSMMNDGRKLCDIMLKYQPVSKKKGTHKGCIVLPWRDNTIIKINDPSLVEK